MKVLVTGGTGDVGRAAVQRLARGGHEVKVIGRREGLALDGAEYRSCDIQDYGALKAQAAGMDAIVHLAAVRGPALGRSQEIFDVNCRGAFHVYQAAAELGIRRVVSASSINALGYFYGTVRFPLSYLPIDEEHPTLATDPYSFSKQVLERIADCFHHREGICGTCLRLPWVYELTAQQVERLRERYEKAEAWAARLAGMGEQERRAWLQDLRGKIDRLRASRAMESRDTWGGGRLSEEEWVLYSGIHNFWTSIDARDSAQAIERSLLADYTGSHPLFVNDSLNAIGLPSRDLLRFFYPEVSCTGGIDGQATLVSIERARALIGFEPEHSLSAELGRG